MRSEDDSAGAAGVSEKYESGGEMSKYNEFLESKKVIVNPVGFKIDDDSINSMLYDYQRDIVKIALWKGRFLLLQDCGLGKAPESLEWAHHVQQQTGKPVLIVAPLGVTYQLEQESKKFNRPITRIRHPDQLNGNNVVTNYEMLHQFEEYTDSFGGIVFDESSIFKSLGGKTRLMALKMVQDISYRLCASATPSPNDYDELLRQAEILGIMKEKEAKALFFIQDGNQANKWRLKGHAVDDFWEWVSEWAVAMRRPSDLGYSDDSFSRADLHIHEIVVPGKAFKNQVGQASLFPMEAKTMADRREARKSTIVERVSAMRTLLNGSGGILDYVSDYVDDEPMIVWRQFLAEADEVTKQLPDVIDIRGSMTQEEKEDRIFDFSNGNSTRIVTDPRMFGHGMNWQHSRLQFFIGLSDSYESVYQAIRRQWRNFQERDVHVFFITASTEGAVVANIKRKEAQHNEMYDQIVSRMAKHYSHNVSQIGRQEMEYKVDNFTTDNSIVYLGDSTEMLKKEPDDSVALTITSVPFPGMYTYTNSARDAGNCKNGEETTEHIKYIMEQVYRVTMPGRLCCIHLTQEPLFKWKDGHVGRLDFRGDIIRMMQEMGWVYWSEISIVKNPQMKAMRTNDSGLTQASVHKDMTRAAPAMNDYVVIFKKLGEGEPVSALISPKYDKWDGWMNMDDWVTFAHGVWQFDDETDLLPLPEEIWLDIQESDILRLNGKQAHVQGRDNEDEKHLCPLQNGVIERLLMMYSNPKDIVLDPFSGQGTTGYWSIKYGRKYRGCELKESYWNLSKRVIDAAEIQAQSFDLFELMESKKEGAR
jgi:DNA modification methylase